MEHVLDRFTEIKKTAFCGHLTRNSHMEQYDVLEKTAIAFIQELREYDHNRDPQDKKPGPQKHEEHDACNILLDSVIMIDRQAVTDTPYFDNLFDLTIEQTRKEELKTNRDHQSQFPSNIYWNIALASGLNTLQKYGYTLSGFHFPQTTEMFGKLKQEPGEPLLIDQFLVGLGEHVNAIPEPESAPGADVIVPDKQDTKDKIRQGARRMLAHHLV